MRGRLKRVGRCPIHGQGCVVTKEIRESTETRASERRRWRREEVARPGYARSGRTEQGTA